MPQQQQQEEQLITRPRINNVMMVDAFVFPLRHVKKRANAAGWPTTTTTTNQNNNDAEDYSFPTTTTAPAPFGTVAYSLLSSRINLEQRQKEQHVVVSDSTAANQNTSNNGTNDGSANDMMENLLNASHSWISDLQQHDKEESGGAEKQNNNNNDGDDDDGEFNLSSWAGSIFRWNQGEEGIIQQDIDDDEEDDDEFFNEQTNDVDDDDDEDVIPPENRLRPMDRQTALDLDKSVTHLDASSLDDDDDDIVILSRYDDDEDDDTTILSEEQAVARAPPLSRPSHYRDRINRDKRQLAFGIAESVQSEWQWQLFCKDGGSIRPLLDMISEGSFTAMQQQQQQQQAADGSDINLEATATTASPAAMFENACLACRILRDLCAISDDLRLILTDEILRANIESGYELMQDVCNLLNRDNTALSGMMLSRPRRRRRRRRQRLWNQWIPWSKVQRRRRRISAQGEKQQGLANHTMTTMTTNTLSGGAAPSMPNRRSKRETKRRSKLHVLQLLLAMCVASDDAIDVLRDTPGLRESIIALSSYAITQKTRQWFFRYPLELWKRFLFRRKKEEKKTAPAFVQAATVSPHDLSGQIQGTANQVLAAMGFNPWVPKIPGQRGLRILCVDGGGTRGMSAIATLNSLVNATGGMEVCDAFDIVCGTSTGAIIAFLVGLRRESIQLTTERYKKLIQKVFGKNAGFATVFTTASYSEAPFVEVMRDILGDSIMLDSRANPAVPYVFAVSSIMSTDPTYVSLLRNYNYAKTARPDALIDNPKEARSRLGISSSNEFKCKVPKPDWRREFERKNFKAGTRLNPFASRYSGSFRALQREAMRKTTAAPTVFKPVKVKDTVYCDGGIVASNPTSIALHEARTLFPHVPVELIVSIGTGGFREGKVAPRIGWDGIIGQIISSATDAERVHHFMEDVFGNGNKDAGAATRYYRFNPLVGTPRTFSIDEKDPQLLAQLYKLTEQYLDEPEQQRKLSEIRDILKGNANGWRKWLFSQRDKKL